MNFEDLKTQIAEIVSICKDVPEEFRTRCFEILLSAALAPQRGGRKQDQDPNEIKGQERQTESSGLTLPGSVKAFMRKKSLTPQEIDKLVMVEEGQFHFLKEPSHESTARGQNEWALLIALKNGIMSNSMTVDPEDVRSTVQEKGFYDRSNFAANFKQAKYATYFKAPLIPQGAAQGLTAEGETALAELIKQLTA